MKLTNQPQLVLAIKSKCLSICPLSAFICPSPIFLYVLKYPSFIVICLFFILYPSLTGPSVLHLFFIHPLLFFICPLPVYRLHFFCPSPILYQSIFPSIIFHICFVSSLHPSLTFSSSIIIRPSAVPQPFILHLSIFWLSSQNSFEISTI